MAVEVSITCEQLERMEKLLYGIPGAVEKVEALALNRGLQTARAQSNREIRKRYAIKQATVNANERVTIRRASGKGGEASITFSGPKIPLYKYTPQPSSRQYIAEKTPVKLAEDKWRTMFKTGNVSAMDSREGGMKRRPEGFIATFQSGHTGIFRRTGGVTASGREKLSEYYGYAVADMLDYEPAKEAVAEATQETVNTRLEHEIGRILERY